MSVPFGNNLRTVVNAMQALDLNPKQTRDVVRVALLLHELHQSGDVTEADLTDIYSGTFSQRLLTRVLRETRNVHFEQTATDFLDRAEEKLTQIAEQVQQHSMSAH